MGVSTDARVLGLGLTVAFWGASFVALKVLLRELGPATITVVRFAVGLAVLAAVSAARRQLQAPRARDLPWLALLGFLGITLHQWLQATGLLSASASVTSWIVASIPVFVALLGWLVLREQLGGWRVAGILLAAAGVSLVVSNGDLRGLLAGTAGTPGDLLIAFSAVNWAIFTILSKRFMQSGTTLSPVTMMLYVMGFGWVFSLIWLGSLRRRAGDPRTQRRWMVGDGVPGDCLFGVGLPVLVRRARPDRCHAGGRLPLLRPAGHRRAGLAPARGTDRRCDAGGGSGHPGRGVDGQPRDRSTGGAHDVLRPHSAALVSV